MNITNTRPLFRPLCTEIVTLFRSLTPEQWERQTIAGDWRVRDVAAHMLDTALRRLSFHRDRLPPPSPAQPFTSERDLAAFVNALNATWLAAARRLSPRVITGLYAMATEELCHFVETFPDDGEALFPVSWAGENASTGLFDIGREFTEIWHHGAQIRDAAGAGPFSDPRWLRVVLEIAMHALPHAYRDVRAPVGTMVLLDIAGPAGGTWILRRADARWTVEPTHDSKANAAARMSDETAWRLLFNALPPGAAGAAVRLEGDRALAAPLLTVRSVIV